MINKKWRPLFWRWHRRLGLVSILFIMLLSVTGILLNHTDDLGLAEQPVHQASLLKLYGIERPRIHSYLVLNEWISYSGEHLYRNAQQIALCTGKFSGVGFSAQSATSPALLAAACGDEIVLFTPQGEPVERITSAYQLPVPLQALGQCELADTPNQRICFSANQHQYALNSATATWEKTTGKVVLVGESALPEALHSALEKNTVSLNWERVILDLHAGRLFGLGPWLMDIVGLFFILLGLSGLGIWLIGKRFNARKVS